VLIGLSASEVLSTFHKPIFSLVILIFHVLYSFSALHFTPVTVFFSAQASIHANLDLSAAVINL